MDGLTELTGTIERVIFKSPDTGFTVFALKVNAHETIIIKGMTGQLHQGSQVVVKGTWGMHPKFGKQLEAVECVAHLPTTRDGVLKYLSSGLIRGIGPSFAERLVNAFGDRTLDVIDKDPERLLRVEGVGPKRLEAIVQAWQEQKEVARVMLFCDPRTSLPRTPLRSTRLMAMLPWKRCKKTRTAWSMIYGA
ncbi:hypothetical protein EBZ39_07860 [bacterium]|nr:hypothetical protein [bacterium]